MSHLDQSYRSVIEGIYKIIYKGQDDVIIITDIFASPQDLTKNETVKSIRANQYSLTKNEKWTMISHHDRL